MRHKTMKVMYRSLKKSGRPKVCPILNLSTCYSTRLEKRGQEDPRWPMPAGVLDNEKSVESRNGWMASTSASFQVKVVGFDIPTSYSANWDVFLTARLELNFYR